MKSENCNYVKMSVAGTFVESVTFLQEEIDILVHIFDGQDQDITANYFHSGIMNPTMEFKNTTTNLSVELARNYTLESWKLTLDEDVLLAQIKDLLLAPQTEWNLALSFPPVYKDSCLIRRAHLSVAMLSSVFTDPTTYFGNAVTPSLSASSKLLSRASPCSRNLQVLTRVICNKIRYVLFYHGPSRPYVRI